ncbi:hypothetical protein JKP88DRAFT_251693 [Tribonema minus]|uniref:Uncharacterized protein n=1 Tax=Tribonema minus TaxID=303371 RepID=A0A835ZCS1_9STRA|nr:hypothetical protein JKP88DRAFT_251693 [Tribonema minus]
MRRRYPQAAAQLPFEKIDPFTKRLDKTPMFDPFDSSTWEQFSPGASPTPSELSDICEEDVDDAHTSFLPVSRQLRSLRDENAKLTAEKSVCDAALLSQTQAGASMATRVAAALRVARAQATAARVALRRAQDALQTAHVAQVAEKNANDAASRAQADLLTARSEAASLKQEAAAAALALAHAERNERAAQASVAQYRAERDTAHLHVAATKLQQVRTRTNLVRAVSARHAAEAENAILNAAALQSAASLASASAQLAAQATATAAPAAAVAQSSAASAVQAANSAQLALEQSAKECDIKLKRCEQRAAGGATPPGGAPSPPFDTGEADADTGTSLEYLRQVTDLVADQPKLKSFMMAMRMKLVGDCKADLTDFDHVMYMASKNLREDGTMMNVREAYEFLQRLLQGFEERLPLAFLEVQKPGITDRELGIAEAETDRLQKSIEQTSRLMRTSPLGAATVSLNTLQPRFALVSAVLGAVTEMMEYVPWRHELPLVVQPQKHSYTILREIAWYLSHFPTTMTDAETTSVIRLYYWMRCSNVVPMLLLMKQLCAYAKLSGPDLETLATMSAPDFHKWSSGDISLYDANKAKRDSGALPDAAILDITFDDYMALTFDEKVSSGLIGFDADAVRAAVWAAGLSEAQVRAGVEAKRVEHANAAGQGSAVRAAAWGGAAAAAPSAAAAAAAVAAGMAGTPSRRSAPFDLKKATEEVRSAGLTQAQVDAEVDNRRAALKLRHAFDAAAMTAALRTKGTADIDVRKALDKKKNALRYEFEFAQRTVSIFKRFADEAAERQRLRDLRADDRILSDVFTGLSVEDVETFKKKDLPSMVTTCKNEFKKVPSAVSGVTPQWYDPELAKALGILFGGPGDMRKHMCGLMLATKLSWCDVAFKSASCPTIVVALVGLLISSTVHNRLDEVHYMTPPTAEEMKKHEGTKLFIIDDWAACAESAIVGLRVNALDMCDDTGVVDAQVVQSTYEGRMEKIAASMQLPSPIERFGYVAIENDVSADEAALMTRVLKMTNQKFVAQLANGAAVDDLMRDYISKKKDVPDPHRLAVKARVGGQPSGGRVGGMMAQQAGLMAALQLKKRPPTS